MRLTVRAYNVGFGDCILISWDEDDRVHHAWVDFGTHHLDDESVYTGVYEDVLARTGGRLDVLMVSHRHLDHLGGFYAMRNRLAADFQVARVWHAHVTAEVDGQFRIAVDTLMRLVPDALRNGAGVVTDALRNEMALTTKARMDAIAGVFAPGSVFAIHRGLDLAASGALPVGLTRMRIDVLAPEEDSRVYLAPIETSLAARSALGDHFEAILPADASAVRAPAPIGVAAGEAPGADEGAGSATAPDAPPDFMRLADFARLSRQLRTGGLDLLAAVNKSRNNTSIVSRWHWQGVTLMLTGDAELESWALMRDGGADLSATLLKVGHHGSINASPTWGFERVFHGRASANGVVLSTNPLIFPTGNEVPKHEVVESWTGRLRYPTRFRRTDAVARGESVTIVFDR